jgi:hypothetical protein
MPLVLRPGIPGRGCKRNLPISVDAHHIPLRQVPLNTPPLPIVEPQLRGFFLFLIVFFIPEHGVDMSVLSFVTWRVLQLGLIELNQPKFASVRIK